MADHTITINNPGGTKSSPLSGSLTSVNNKLISQLGKEIKKSLKEALPKTTGGGKGSSTVSLDTRTLDLLSRKMASALASTNTEKPTTEADIKKAVASAIKETLASDKSAVKSDRLASEQITLLKKLVTAGNKSQPVKDTSSALLAGLKKAIDSDSSKTLSELKLITKSLGDVTKGIDKLSVNITKGASKGTDQTGNIAKLTTKLDKLASALESMSKTVSKIDTKQSDKGTKVAVDAVVKNTKDLKDAFLTSIAKLSNTAEVKSDPKLSKALLDIVASSKSGFDAVSKAIDRTSKEERKELVEIKRLLTKLLANSEKVNNGTSSAPTQQSLFNAPSPTAKSTTKHKVEYDVNVKSTNSWGMSEIDSTLNYFKGGLERLQNEFDAVTKQKAKLDVEVDTTEVAMLTTKLNFLVKAMAEANKQAMKAGKELGMSDSDVRAQTTKIPKKHPKITIPAGEKKALQDKANSMVATIDDLAFKYIEGRAKHLESLANSEKKFNLEGAKKELASFKKTAASGNTGLILKKLNLMDYANPELKKISDALKDSLVAYSAVISDNASTVVEATKQFKDSRKKLTEVKDGIKTLGDSVTKIKDSIQDIVKEANKTASTIRKGSSEIGQRAENIDQSRLKRSGTTRAGSITGPRPVRTVLPDYVKPDDLTKEADIFIENQVEGLSKSLKNLQDFMSERLRDQLKKSGDNWKVLDDPTTGSAFGQTPGGKQFALKIASRKALKTKLDLPATDATPTVKLLENFNESIKAKLRAQYSAVDDKAEAIGKWIKTAPKFTKDSGVAIDYTEIKKDIKGPTIDAKVIKEIKRISGDKLQTVFEQTFLAAQTAIQLEAANVLKTISIPSIKLDESSNPFIGTKFGAKRAIPKFATYKTGFEGFEEDILGPRGKGYTKKQEKTIREVGLRPKGSANISGARELSKELVTQTYAPAFTSVDQRSSVMGRYKKAATIKTGELSRLGAAPETIKAFESNVDKVAKDFSANGTKANAAFSDFINAMGKVGLTSYDIIKSFEKISQANFYDKLHEVISSTKVLDKVAKKAGQTAPYRRLDRIVSQTEQFAPIVEGGKPRRASYQSNVVNLTSMTGGAYRDLGSTDQTFQKSTIRDLNRRISEISQESKILRSTSKEGAKVPIELSNLSSLGLPESQAGTIAIPSRGKIFSDDDKEFVEGIKELKTLKGVTIKMHAEDLTSLSPFGTQFQQPGRNIANVSGAHTTVREILDKVNLKAGIESGTPTLKTQAEQSRISAGRYGSTGYGFNVTAELRNTASTFEDQIVVSGKLAKAITTITKQIVAPGAIGAEGKGAQPLTEGELEVRVTNAAKQFADTIGVAGYEYKGRADKVLISDVQSSVAAHQGQSIEVQSAKIAEIFLNSFGRKLTTRYGSKGVSVTATGTESLAQKIRDFGGKDTEYKLSEAGLGAAKMPKSMGKLLSEVFSGGADVTLRKELIASGNKFILSMFKDTEGIIADPSQIKADTDLFETIQKRIPGLKSGAGMDVDRSNIKVIKDLYTKEFGKEGLTEVKPIDVRISAHGLAKRGLQPELLETIMGNVAGGTSDTTLKTDLPDYKKLLGPTGALSPTSSALGYKSSVSGQGESDALEAWAKDVSKGDTALQERLIKLEKDSNYYVDIIDEFGKERKSLVGPKFVQIVEEAGKDPAWTKGQIGSRDKGIKLNLLAYDAYETVFGQGSDFMKSITSHVNASNKKQWEYIKALQATVNKGDVGVQGFLSNLETKDLSEFKSMPERLGSFGLDDTEATSLRKTVADVETFFSSYKVGLPTLDPGVKEDFYIPGPSIREATPDKLAGGKSGMSTTARALQNVIDDALALDKTQTEGINLEDLKKAYGQKLFSGKPNTDYLKRGLSVLKGGGNVNKRTPIILSKALGKLDDLPAGQDASGLAAQLDPDLEQEMLGFKFKQLEESKYRYYEELANNVLGKGKGIEQALIQKRIPSIMAKAVTAVVDRTSELEEFKGDLAAIFGGSSKELLSDDEIKQLSNAYDEIGAIKTEHAEKVKGYRDLQLPVLKQHEIGIPKSQAAKLPGFSEEDPYVESVRFPFTGTSSIQPYKAKILDDEKYKNVFAVPGVPEMDMKSFDEQIGAVQAVRGGLSTRREAAWESGDVEAAKELTNIINRLNEAITQVIPRYIAHQQKLDFDGDAIQIHSAETEAARKDIKKHFDLLNKDVSSTGAVFRDKFTSDANQQSTGQFMLGEMSQAFSKKFPTEKGFKFLEAPSLTPKLSHLEDKEKLNILAGYKTTAGDTDPLKSILGDVKQEMGQVKYDPQFDTLMESTKSVDELFSAIGKLDGGFQEMIKGIISAEVYAARFGDAVEAQLFKIHTGMETEGMTRLQRIFENRMGTGPGMISGSQSFQQGPDSFAKERTTQMNELLRFSIQKGMDVKHAGGATVASDILGPMLTKNEEALMALMDQIKAGTGSYGELKDFMESNEEAIRGAMGEKSTADVRTYLEDVYTQSNELRGGKYKRKTEDVSALGSRKDLIDQVVKVLGFEGFMDDVQKALASEVSTTPGAEKVPEVSKIKDPVYSLRTSSASIESVAAGDLIAERKRREKAKLPELKEGTLDYRKLTHSAVVEEVNRALLSSTNSQDKRTGSYTKAIQDALTTGKERSNILADFEKLAPEGYKPTPFASGSILAKKLSTLPEGLSGVVSGESKDLTKVLDSLGIPRTQDYKETELLNNETISTIAGMFKSDLDPASEEFAKASQEFLANMQKSILTLYKVDKALYTLKTSPAPSDLISTQSTKLALPEEPDYKPAVETTKAKSLKDTLQRRIDKAIDPAGTMANRSQDIDDINRQFTAAYVDPYDEPPKSTGVGAGIPMVPGQVVDVRLVDVTGNVLKYFEGIPSVSKQPMDVESTLRKYGDPLAMNIATGEDVFADPATNQLADHYKELMAKAKEADAYIANRLDDDDITKRFGAVPMSEAASKVRTASKYDALEKAPQISKEEGTLGTFENLKALHEQARAFQSEARGISFDAEEPNMNESIREAIELARTAGKNYPEFVGLIDELKNAETITGGDAYKAFKLYKLAVGDYYLSQAEAAKKEIDAANAIGDQSKAQSAYTKFTDFTQRMQKDIRSGLGKQSDVYTSDKRYVSPELARGAGVYMSPGAIASKAAAPLPEDQKIFDVYEKIVSDTGGQQRMKAPIEKARDAIKSLTNADDELIKLIENGKVMERLGSDIKEAWQFEGIEDNISRLREALEMYKKFSVSSDSLAAERKNIDSVIKYLKNVEDIYTKIDTRKAQSEGPSVWGDTGAIKVPTWLDPEQQLALHKRNVQKLKEYYTKAAGEGGAKIGERQAYKTQVKDTSGNVLVNKVTDFHKYAESLDNAGEAIGRYSAKERDLTAIMQGSTRGFGAAITRALKWGAASTVVYGGFQQLKSAIGTMADIETSLAQLRMVMNPMGADFGALGDSAVMFAKKYGVGVDDALQSMKVFAQQGLSQAEIIDRTNTSTLAANVTTLSATDATEALTAAMKIFGNEADSSMKYLDAWSEVEARHAITAEDMANAIKKSASAAKNAGVTFDQLNGIVAAIGSTTRQSGKEVGTSMRFIFRRLSSDKGPKELAKLQVPTLTGEGELRSGFDVLGDLAMKWKDLTSAQKMNTAQAIGGTRQYNSLLVLMDNWDQALQAVKDSTNSKGSAERKNAEIMKTYAKQLEQTRAAAVELQMAFGKVVLPGFKVGLKVSKTLLETISAIPDPIKAIGAGTLLFLGYLNKGADIIDAIKGGLGGVSNVFGGVGKSLKDELEMAKFEVLGDKGVSPLISTGLSTLGSPVMSGPEGMEPQKQTLHEFQSTLGKTAYLIKEMGMTYNSVIGSMAVTTGGFVEKSGEKLANFSSGLGFGAGALHKSEGKRTFEEATGRATHLGLSATSVGAGLAKEGFKGLSKTVMAAAGLGTEMAAIGGLSAGIVIDKFGETLGAGGKKVAEDWAASNSSLVEAVAPLAATTLLLVPALKAVYGHYIGLSRTAKGYKEAIYGIKRTQQEELASIRSLIGEYDTLKMKMEDISKASDPKTKVRRQELGTYESPLLSTAKMYEGAKGTANSLAESNTNLVLGYDALGNAILRTSDNFEHFMSVAEKSKLKELAKTDVGVAAKYIEELTTTEGPEQWKYGVKQFIKEVPVIGDMLAKNINVSPAKMLKVMTDNLNKALSARSKNPMATAIDKDIKDYQAQLAKIKSGFQSSYSDFRKAISDISTKGLDANEITNIFSSPELKKGWQLMLEVEPTLNTNALRGKTKWQDLLGAEVLSRANQGANLGFNAQLTKAQQETAGGASRQGVVRSNDIVTFLDGAASEYDMAGNQAIVKLKETTDGVFEWVAQYFNSKTLKIEERTFDQDMQNLVDGIFPQQAIQEDISDRIDSLNEFVAGAGAGLRGIDKKTFKKDFSLGERFYSDIATSTLLQSDKGFTPGGPAGGGGFGPVDFQSDWAESFKQFYAKPMEEYKNKLADIDKLRLAGLEGEKVNLATGLYEDLVKLQEVLKNNQVVLQYRAVLVDLSKTFEQGARAIQESLAVERSRMEIFQGQGKLAGVPEGLDIPDIKGYTRTKMTASERVFADNPAAVELAKKIKELEITKSGTADQVYSADKALVALQSIQSVSKGFGASLTPGDLSKYTETVARTGDTGIAELKLDTNKMVDNTAATVERLDAILANISGISEIETLSNKFEKAGMSPEAIENTLEKVARVREKAIDAGDTNTVVASNTLLDKLSKSLAEQVGVAKSISMVEGNMTLFSKRYSGQEQAQRAFGGLGAGQLVGELKDVLPTEKKWFGLKSVEGQPTFEKDVSSLKRLQEKNNAEQLISSKSIIKAASASSVYNALQTRADNKTLDAYDKSISGKVTDLEKARGAGDEGDINKLVKELSTLKELRDKEQKSADFTKTVQAMSMLTSGSMQFAKAMGLTETQIKMLGGGAVGLYGAVKITSKLMSEELPEAAKAFEEALREATSAIAAGEKPSASTIVKGYKAGQALKDEFPGKAAGGAISGPGNGTSDDILTRLSDGEYVIKADSTSKLGKRNLDYMNTYGKLPQHAEGGPITAAPSIHTNKMTEYDYLMATIQGKEFEPGSVEEKKVSFWKEAGKATLRGAGIWGAGTALGALFPAAGGAIKGATMATLVADSLYSKYRMGKGLFGGTDKIKTDEITPKFAEGGSVTDVGLDNDTKEFLQVAGYSTVAFKTLKERESIAIAAKKFAQSDIGKLIKEGAVSTGQYAKQGALKTVTLSKDILKSKLAKTLGRGALKVGKYATSALSGPLGWGLLTADAVALAKFLSKDEDGVNNFFAEGGKVSGLGGPKDDSILARVSNGEFIINAAAASSLGQTNLDYMNTKGMLPAFAAGGAVGTIDEVQTIKDALAQQAVVDSVKIDSASINKLGQVMAATLAATFSGYVAEQNTETTKIATAAAKASEEAAKIADIVRSNPEAAQRVFDKYYDTAGSSASASDILDTIDQSLVLNNDSEFKKVSENIAKMRKEMIDATKDMSEEAAVAREALLKMRLAEEIKIDVESVKASLRSLKIDSAVDKYGSEITKQGSLSKMFMPKAFTSDYDRAVSTQGLMTGKYQPTTDIDAITEKNRNYWDLTPSQLMSIQNPDIVRASSSPFEGIRDKFKYAVGSQAGDFKVKKDPLFGLPYMIEGSITKAFGAFAGTNLRQRSAESQLVKIDDTSAEIEAYKGLIKKYTAQSLEYTAQGETGLAEDTNKNLAEFKQKLGDLNLGLGVLIADLDPYHQAYKDAIQNLQDTRALVSKIDSDSVNRQFTTQSLYGTGLKGVVEGLQFAPTSRNVTPEQSLWQNADDNTRQLIEGYKNSELILEKISQNIIRQKDEVVNLQSIIANPKDYTSGDVKLAKQRLGGGPTSQGLEDQIAAQEKQATLVTGLSKVMHDGLRAMVMYTEGLDNFNNALYNLRLNESVQDLNSYKSALEAQERLLGSGDFKGKELTTWDEQFQASQVGIDLGLSATSKEKELASLQYTMAKASPGQDLTRERRRAEYLQSPQYDLDQERRKIMTKSANDARALGSQVDSRVMDLQRYKDSGTVDEQTQSKLGDEIKNLLSIKKSFMEPVSYERALEIGDDAQDKRNKEAYDKGFREFLVPDPKRFAEAEASSKDVLDTINTNMTERVNKLLGRSGMSKEDTNLINLITKGNTADAVKISLLSDIVGHVKRTADALKPEDKSGGPSGAVGDSILGAANLVKEGTRMALNIADPRSHKQWDPEKKELVDRPQLGDWTISNLDASFQTMFKAADDYITKPFVSLAEALGTNVAKAVVALDEAGSPDLVDTAKKDYHPISKKASGGFISGHGGPREDNIPAMLSKGEYVVRAHSTAKLGKKTLDYMNSTGDVPAFNGGGKLSDEQVARYRGFYDQGWGETYGIAKGGPFDANVMHRAAINSSKVPTLKADPEVPKEVEESLIKESSSSSIHASTPAQAKYKSTRYRARALLGMSLFSEGGKPDDEQIAYYRDAYDRGLGEFYGITKGDPFDASAMHRATINNRKIDNLKSSTEVPEDVKSGLSKKTNSYAKIHPATPGQAQNLHTLDRLKAAFGLANGGQAEEDYYRSLLEPPEDVKKELEKKKGSAKTHPATPGQAYGLNIRDRFKAMFGLAGGGFGQSILDAWKAEGGDKLDTTKFFKSLKNIPKNIRSEYIKEGGKLPFQDVISKQIGRAKDGSLLKDLKGTARAAKGAGKNIAKEYAKSGQKVPGAQTAKFAMDFIKERYAAFNSGLAELPVDKTKDAIGKTSRTVGKVVRSPSAKLVGGATVGGTIAAGTVEATLANTLLPYLATLGSSAVGSITAGGAPAVGLAGAGIIGAGAAGYGIGTLLEKYTGAGSKLGNLTYDLFNTEKAYDPSKDKYTEAGKARIKEETRKRKLYKTGPEIPKKLADISAIEDGQVPYFVPRTSETPEEQFLNPLLDDSGQPFFGKDMKGRKNVFTNIGFDGIHKLNDKGEYEKLGFKRKYDKLDVSNINALSKAIPGTTAKSIYGTDSKTGITVSRPGTLKSREELAKESSNGIVMDFSGKKKSRYEEAKAYGTDKSGITMLPAGAKVIEPKYSKKRVVSATKSKTYNGQEEKNVPLLSDVKKHAVTTDTKDTPRDLKFKNKKFKSMLDAAHQMAKKYDYYDNAEPGLYKSMDVLEGNVEGDRGAALLYIRRYMELVNNKRIFEPEHLKAQIAFDKTQEGVKEREDYFDFRKTEEKIAAFGNIDLLNSKSGITRKEDFDTYRAMGGKIMSKFGTGGPKADDIPAMVSAGEYIINSHSASKIGDQALSYINKTGNLPTFAEGGGVLTTNHNALNYGSSSKIYLDVEQAADDLEEALISGAAKAKFKKVALEEVELKIEEDQRVLIFPEDVPVLKVDNTPLKVDDSVLLKVDDSILLQVEAPVLTITDTDLKLSDNTVVLADNKVTLDDRTVSLVDTKVTAVLADNKVTLDNNTVTAILDDRTVILEDNKVILADNKVTLDDHIVSLANTEVTAILSDNKVTLDDRTVILEDNKVTLDDRTVSLDDRTVSLDNTEITAVLADNKVTLDDRTVSLENDVVSAVLSDNKVTLEDRTVTLDNRTVSLDNTEVTAVLADNKVILDDHTVRLANDKVTLEDRTVVLTDNKVTLDNNTVTAILDDNKVTLEDRTVTLDDRTVRLDDRTVSLANTEVTAILSDNKVTLDDRTVRLEDNKVEISNISDIASAIPTNNVGADQNNDLSELIREMNGRIDNLNDLPEKVEILSADNINKELNDIKADLSSTQTSFIQNINLELGKIRSDLSNMTSSNTGLSNHINNIEREFNNTTQRLLTDVNSLKGSVKV